MNVFKGSIFLAINIVGLNIFCGAASAQPSNINQRCQSNLNQYRQNSQQFDSTVQSTGGNPMLTDRLQTGALGLVVGCTDQYVILVNQNRSVCSEAQAYLTQAINLSSASPSAISVQTNSGRINAICAAPVVTTPVVPATTNPVAPTISPIPDVETEMGLDSTVPTEIESPEVALVTPTPDEDSSNEISAARITETSVPQPWLNKNGPFYTVSDLSSLSTSVPFAVSEGSSVVATTNGGILNVRSGAGLDNPVIGSLVNGTSALLTGMKDDGWVQIRDGGWVHSDYVSPR